MQAINSLNNILGVEPTNLEIVNKSRAISTPPFQIFLDEAVKSLQDISNVEMQNNNLINDFVQGKVSVEEVMVSTNKLSLAVSMATTVLNNAVQSFQQIQQMQI